MKTTSFLSNYKCQMEGSLYWVAKAILLKSILHKNGQRVADRVRFISTGRGLLRLKRMQKALISS